VESGDRVGWGGWGGEGDCAGAGRGGVERNREKGVEKKRKGNEKK
jgi:hypothetical protein